MKRANIWELYLTIFITRNNTVQKGKKFMMNSLIKGVGNFLGTGLETYGKNWKEKPANNLTSHTTVAVAAIAVNEQKKIYRLQKKELEIKQNLAIGHSLKVINL